MARAGNLRDPATVPALDRRTLELELGKAFTTIEVHDRLPSTNLRAANLALAPPVLVLCNEQTAGRGRRDRTWVSAAGSSLTFSVAYGLGGRSPSGLSLAVAVGAAEALEGLGYSTELKWPNDLLGPAGGKLGGILVEIGGDRAVAGIGINLASFPGLCDEPGVECLFDQGVCSIKEKVAAEVSLGILSWLDVWRDEGMAAVRSAWLERTTHRRGDWLMVSEAGGDKKRMEYLGIGEEGELLARDQDGLERRIHSAELNRDIACGR